MPPAVHPATAPHSPEAVLAAGGPLPSRCRSCAAPILWAVTKSADGGFLVAVDERSHPDGWLALERDRDALWVTIAADGDRVRYRSHLKTCPEANRWQRT